MVFFAFVAPPNLRQPAIVAAFGLVIVCQIIIMWGNRGMVTPYTQAQRYFRDGEFEKARDTLQAEINASKRPDVNQLILLGNSYRNLGEVEQSEEVLRQAVSIWEDYHFGRYGLGRILMARGEYMAALDELVLAKEYGAPELVHFDIAHCHYRLGDLETATTLLQSEDLAVYEPHRRLMSLLILSKKSEDVQPSTQDLEQGLEFWQAEADRFTHTVYGQSLQSDIHAMQSQFGG